MIIPTTEPRSDFQKMFDAEKPPEHTLPVPYKDWLSEEEYYTDPDLYPSMDKDEFTHNIGVEGNADPQQHSRSLPLLLRWDQLLGIRQWPEVHVDDATTLSPLTTVTNRREILPGKSGLNAFSRNASSLGNKLSTKLPHYSSQSDDLDYTDIMNYIVGMEQMLICILAGFIVGWVCAKCCSSRSKRRRDGVVFNGENGQPVRRVNAVEIDAEGAGVPQYMDNAQSEHQQRTPIPPPQQQQPPPPPPPPPLIMNNNIGNNSQNNGSRFGRNYRNLPSVVVPRSPGASNLDNQMINPMTGATVHLPPAHLRMALLRRQNQNRGGRARIPNNSWGPPLP